MVGLVGLGFGQLVSLGGVGWVGCGLTKTWLNNFGFGWLLWFGWGLVSWSQKSMEIGKYFIL